jgi:hypothetical protein
LVFKSAHAIDEDIELESITTATETPKIVSAHETESIVDEVGGASRKKPCCPWCRNEAK